MTVRIHIGDCREVLKTLPAESVHCVVTSPPYWGLRDYGVSGQIGLEGVPIQFIDELVSVFREVHRVLRADGTLWLNMGDSYAGSGRGGNPTEETSGLEGGQSSQQASIVKRSRPAAEIGKTARDAAVTNVARRATRGSQLPAGYHENARQAGAVGRAWTPAPEGFKQKDLMGMPWRIAFALQADGWYLRQDIIWNKPNPMPESVRDRCTKAHEYVFLLAKSEKYYYDFDAMQEPVSGGAHPRRPDNGVGFGHGTDKEKRSRDRYKRPAGWADGPGAHDTVQHNRGERKRKLAESGSGTKNNESMDEALAVMPTTRNRRSVWTITTEAFKEAHFATFPTELVKPCILAGSPRGGVILDPFGGAGTTGLVAERLQRDSILIELKPEYAAMAERRIRDDAPVLADVRIA